ncbi:MAG: MG2 domain-containing protein [Candidatus Paceibacterota bacterium]
MRDNSNLNPRNLCSEVVEKTIALSADKPGLREFNVNIQDYFPQAIGNYVVMISSPLVTEQSDYSWKYSTRTYVSVTNLIVTEKRIDPLLNNNYDSIQLTGDQLSKLQNLYWVIDASTQKPVTGASVSLFKDGQVMGTAVTNDKGLAFLTPVAGSDMAVASYGADSALISGYSTRLNYASEAVNVKKMYIYSDKPIYRPGQEVNIKGIYRLGYDGYYELPPTEPVTLTIRDSGNEIVKEVNLTPNNFGSVSTTFTLANGAHLGTYSVCVKFQCSSFDVLNYAPAAFKVDLQTAKDEYFMGDQPQVNVNANYYFGVPVSNASADYHVSSQYYYFDKYSDEYFNFNNLSDDTTSEGYYYGDRYLGDGHVSLDENGKALINPKIDPSSLKDPAVSKIITIDATVKNQEGRSISAQESFILNAASTYLGSKIEDPFLSASQAINLKLKSVDTSGKAKSYGMTATLYRVTWVNNGVGSSYRYSNWQRKRELIKTFSASTDASGNGQLSLLTQSAGQYEVDVTSGGAVGSRSWFYVYGSDNVSVRSSDDTSLELVPGNATVKTGQNAEVLIKVPEGTGKALVTVERGKIFTYEIIDINGTMTNYKFPVVSQYYPDVYVSVTVYSPNRSVRFGSYLFTVNSDQKKISLSIQADKKLYNPGDQVTLELSARDEKGQPVISDVSVAVVDLSVLALRGNPKKDPLSTFYGHVPLTVETYSNFKNLLKQTERTSSDGKGGSGGDANKEKSRGIFKEVAFWHPNILTDANGQATVKFTLPDNLTTWQAEVVGVTKDTQVGVAYTEFMTNKTLMVVPLKPRFVLPGDKFSLGATVFNNSDANFSGSFSLKADALNLTQDSLSKNISIKAHSSQAVYWEVSVPAMTVAGPLSYSISAAGQNLSDAIDDTLTINENSAYEVTATAGQTSSSATEAVYVPQTIIPGQGGLTLKSSATLAVYLGDALKYMLDYPYDCTEQIGSRIQTLALMKNAGILVDNEVKNKADGLVKSGLQSIYDRQNPDGGFKLWSDDRQSSYWATLEAIKTLDVLQSSGYAIDSSVWDKSAAYIHDAYFAKQLTYFVLDPIDLAKVLFTRPQYLGQGDVMQVFTQAAQSTIKDPKASTAKLITLSQILHRYGLMSEVAVKADLMLSNRLVVDSRGSFLDLGPNNSYTGTAISNTAGYIDLLSLRRQSDIELPNLMRWLVRSRSKDGAWGSTTNTLAVVRALTSYIRWQPETAATFTLENTLNGKEVQKFDYKPDNILTQLTKTIPMDGLRTGSLSTVNFQKSNIKGSDVGKIYYDMSFKYYLPANTLGPRDEGFSIERNFYALSDKDGTKPIQKAKVGDIIREHVEVTVPVTRNQVVLEDFIPAGTEIVDTSLATEDKTLQDVGAVIKNSRLWPDHKEWRDDRAFLYFDQLSPGTYQFDYVVRALVPGTYSVLPANVSEMYTPENFGRSGASLFTIEK